LKKLLIENSKKLKEKILNSKKKIFKINIKKIEKIFLNDELSIYLKENITRFIRIFFGNFKNQIKHYPKIFYFENTNLFINIKKLKKKILKNENLKKKKNFIPIFNPKKKFYLKLNENDLNNNIFILPKKKIKKFKKKKIFKILAYTNGINLIITIFYIENNLNNNFTKTFISEEELKKKLEFYKKKKEEKKKKKFFFTNYQKNFMKNIIDILNEKNFKYKTIKCFMEENNDNKILIDNFILNEKLSIQQIQSFLSKYFRTKIFNFDFPKKKNNDKFIIKEKIFEGKEDEKMKFFKQYKYFVCCDPGINELINCSIFNDNIFLNNFNLKNSFFKNETKLKSDNIKFKFIKKMKKEKIYQKKILKKIEKTIELNENKEKFKNLFDIKIYFNNEKEKKIFNEKEKKIYYKKKLKKLKKIRKLKNNLFFLLKKKIGKLIKFSSKNVLVVFGGAKFKSNTPKEEIWNFLGSYYDIFILNEVFFFFFKFIINKN
jgi:hypothetical protein